MGRRVLLIFLLIFLLSAPIYGAARVLLPEWVKQKAISFVPAQNELSIGEMSSLTNLSILYEDVTYKTPKYTLEVDKLLVKPRINIESPLVFNAENLEIRENGNATVFRNVDIKLVFPKNSFHNIALDGEAALIEGPYKSILSETKFLLEGFNKRDKTLVFQAERVNSEILFPAAIANIGLGGLELNIAFNEEIKINSKVMNSDIRLSSYENDTFVRDVVLENILFEMALLKKELWTLPFKLSADNIRSPVGPIANRGAINAIGVWNQESRSCDVSEIISRDPSCGKMINLIDLSVLLSDTKGLFDFSGSGYCVAPKSGCPQRIDALLKSKSTTEIFSQVMTSGLLSPFLGGVILGALLSSPSLESSSYDHKAHIKVIGSHILLNGKPLI